MNWIDKDSGLYAGHGTEISHAREGSAHLSIVRPFSGMNGAGSTGSKYLLVVYPNLSSSGREGVVVANADTIADLKGFAIGWYAGWKWSASFNMGGLKSHMVEWLFSESVERSKRTSHVAGMLASLANQIHRSDASGTAVLDAVLKTLTDAVDNVTEAFAEYSAENPMPRKPVPVEAEEETRS